MRFLAVGIMVRHLVFVLFALALLLVALEVKGAFEGYVDQLAIRIEEVTEGIGSLGQ